jgi:vitamin B12 transporter
MSLPKLIQRGAAVVAALLLGSGFAGAEEVPAEPEFVVVDGDTLWLVEVVDVLGSRVTAALPGVVRTVDMVSAEELRRLPGRSPAELLQTVPGVVTGQRQQYGVQSDLSIRGSSFEQVQVLLDGFDLADPQTGHHLMDLPVGRQDLRRLEVLPGHGSTLYGSGAFGGTINVVTKKPALPDTAGHPLFTQGEAALYGGQNGAWGGWGSAEAALGQRTGLRLSGEGFRTDGYLVEGGDGTYTRGLNDADTWSGTARLSHRFARGEADVFAGYAHRNFGAQDFYAPYDSYEKTRTFFAAARYNRNLSDRLTIEPRVFFRRHTDEFILIRINPGMYTNDHSTRKAGGELRALVTLNDDHALAVSLEGVYEDIDSRGLRITGWGDALGSHLRRRFSVAAELDGKRDRLRWQLGSRLDRRSGFAGRLSGSGAASLDLGAGLAARASAGSVYRVPTFTELYYESPTDLGDPRLDAERGWTWDVGLEHLSGPWQLRATYFERHENGLIEWARPVPGPADEPAPWRALNLGEGQVTGLETLIGWRHGQGHFLQASYAVLDKETTLPAGMEGKYALITPERQLVLQGTVVLQPGLSLTLTGRYLEHTAGPEDFRHVLVLDNRVDWNGTAGWFLSMAGTNLLDRRYQEVPGVPMPGSLYTTTVGWRF